MMHSGSLSLVRLFLLFSIGIQCTDGKFYWDLFQINAMSPAIITKKHTSSVVGPKDDQRGIKFSEGVPPIMLNTSDYAYIANTFQTSDDVTFSVYFKILSMDKKETTYFPFFALSDTKLQNNYFAIEFVSKRPYITSEGERQYKDMTWSLNIDKWLWITRSSTKTEFPLGKVNEHIKLGKWMILMVRIRGASVRITIDCKVVETTKTLKEGRIGPFSTDGYFTLSQYLLKGRRKQFVGSMYEPQIFSGGELAYAWLSPCDRDNRPSVIKPEPRPGDYNDKKFEQFQKMNNQNQTKLLLYCVDEKGIKHRSNGDSWKRGKCFKYKCLNGVKKEFRTCGNCSVGTSQYLPEQKWISKTDNCVQKYCKDGRQVEEIPIVCKTLTCPLDEQYTPDGKCCKKCRGEDCTKGRVYYNGCERKCAYGMDQKCDSANMKKGCYCGEGKAMNHKNTTCVPTAACRCKVSTNMYLPGQAITRSLCIKCICSHGKLVCFSSC